MYNNNGMITSGLLKSNYHRVSQSQNNPILYSKRVLIDGTLQEATLYVQNGVIKEVRVNYKDKQASSVGNSVVMPGLIDSHVHINEPGRTEWEGFETATKAAAAGGITTLIDMPLNSSPVTTSVNSFRDKLKASEGKLFVNCGFWGGLVPGSVHEIEGLINEGAMGIKAFLTHSGIDEFPNVTDKELRPAMKLLARMKKPLLVHCELSDDSNYNALIDNPKSYMAYLKSRPRYWEDAAVKMMVALCRETACKTHIVHLSSATAIKIIQEAKEEGLPISCETCSHYLFFDAENIPDGQTVYKCAPPIREKGNNDRLWQALKDEIIDFIITDHSPALPEIKELETGNLLKAWGGISGLQFSLPAVWKRAEEKGFTIADISKLMSENVAAFLGLEHKKGRIAPGFDADLLVWNPEKEFVPYSSDIVHKHKISPYIGCTLKGAVQQTYVGGVKVFAG